MVWQIEKAWRDATADQKRALYFIAQDLMRAHAIEFKVLCRQALGMPDPGDGYEINARSGRMGVRRCIMLHQWMRLHHHEFGRRVDTEIFRLPLTPVRKELRHHNNGGCKCAECLRWTQGRSERQRGKRNPSQLWDDVER